MELKPRFEYRYSGSVDALETQLSAALSRPDASCTGGIREGFLELSLRSKRPPFWAPQLRARLIKRESDTLIRGRFAPKPETWTFFMAVYAAVVFSTGIGAVYGFSQYSLGHEAWALWSIPIGIVLVAFVWLGARLGQGLGADGMQMLTSFVHESLGSADPARD